jgi:asparagine synthase (glutamine-hydrolysing)
VYALRTTQSLVSYLSTRANYVTAGLPLGTFLTPEAARQAGTGAGGSYAALLEKTPLSPAAACSYLYLRELNRRFTVPSLELFRTQVEVRLPYLNSTFLKVLLAAPPAWRDTTRIHQALTATGIPRLLKVRNSNSGAPADAGPGLEYVLDKVNTALKRLNVPGFRHYHNFDAWMRRQLLETVTAELLTPASRVLPIVSKPALTRLIAETRDGHADRGYLLQILLILELWQRENRVEAAA